MKVLVVDDNPIVRAGLSAVLSRMRDVTEVIEAENAFAALEMTARCPYASRAKWSRYPSRTFAICIGYYADVYS